MSRNEALIIAKIAHNSISRAIDEIKKTFPESISIDPCWDGCIGVDEWLFHENELVEMVIL